MEKVITYENLRSFAYSNDRLCVHPIRGVVLTFNGLGFSSMSDTDDEYAKNLAEKGIIQIVPYFNPWSWMNRQTVAFTDELIDVLAEQYELPEIPIVSSGGSMGGLSALVFPVYSVHKIAACVANCPVCDLPYHYTERPDLPRTLYSAFGGYEGTLEEALRSASPLHLIDRMPHIPYYIFHCEEDLAVNKKMHSDRLVQAMSGKYKAEYFSVAGKGHCDLTPEMWEAYHRIILEHAQGIAKD